METLRSWILGSSTPSGSSASNHEKQAAERSKVLLQQQQQQQNATEPERLATLARAQTIQLGQLMDECNEIEEQLAAIDPIKERTRALHLIQQKKQVKAEAESMSQKLENTRRQQKILDQARINLEQQKALQESAVELKALSIAGEAMNVQESVDVIQDAVKDLKYQDKLLTKPVFGGGLSSTIVEQDEAEQELAALMAKHHLPSVPTTTVAAAPAATTVAVEEAKEVEEKLKASN